MVVVDTRILRMPAIRIKGQRFDGEVVGWRSGVVEDGKAVGGNANLRQTTLRAGEGA